MEKVFHPYLGYHTLPFLDACYLLFGDAVLYASGFLKVEGVDPKLGGWLSSRSHTTYIAIIFAANKFRTNRENV